MKRLDYLHAATHRRPFLTIDININFNVPNIDTNNIMHTLKNEALIQASADTVYDVLIDVEGYSQWNPWNIAGEGMPAIQGPLIKISAKLGNRIMTVKHKILTMERGRAFVWCDTGLFTYFTMGKRSRFLTPHPEGVHYQVQLELSGPLVWFTRLIFEKQIITGMEKETQALKKRAEEIYLAKFNAAQKLSAALKSVSNKELS
jgi:hypothetical protein